jgi:hypothetical protein
MTCVKFVVLLGLFFLAPGAASEAGTTCNTGISVKGNKIAIVLSNQRYGTFPLRTAHNDAEAISEALIENGYEVSCFKDLDKYNLELFLRNIHDSLFSFRGDVFVYFTGHGWNDGQTNFFLSTDGHPSHPTAEQSANVDRLVEGLGFSRARQLIFIFDICRGLDQKSKFATPKNIESSVRESKDVIIAYSAGFGTFAHDGQKKYSPFGGSLAGYMRSSWGISVQDILSLTSRNVARLSTKYHFYQVPSFVSLSSRQLFLNTDSTGLKGLQFLEDMEWIGIHNVASRTLSSDQKTRAMLALVQLIRRGLIGYEDSGDGCKEYFKSLIDKGDTNVRYAEIEGFPNNFSGNSSMELYRITFATPTCASSADGNSLITILGHNYSKDKWHILFQDLVTGVAMKTVGAQKTKFVAHKYAGSSLVVVTLYDFYSDKLHVAETILVPIGFQNTPRDVDSNLLDGG